MELYQTKVAYDDERNDANDETHEVIDYSDQNVYIQDYQLTRDR